MSFDIFLKTLGSKKSGLAVLVDPDKYNPELIQLCEKENVSCFFVGGSILERGSVDKTIRKIKRISQKPVLIFPGDVMQLSSAADGLLLLSLLSGRNPEYLIGQQVKAAPLIKKMKLKTLSTAYLLIGGKHISSTQKVTGTHPLELNNRKLIVDTCIAAELLGFAAIYLEAGSGSASAIPASLIKKVKQNVKLPLLVGGGITSAARVRQVIAAGADLVVVGNALEKNVYLVTELSSCF